MPNPIGSQYMGVNPVANALEPPIQILLNLMQQQAKRNDLLTQILAKTKETKVDPFELEKLKQKHRLEIKALPDEKKQFAPQRPSYDPRITALQNQLNQAETDLIYAKQTEKEASRKGVWEYITAANTRKSLETKRDEIAKALSAGLIEQGRASREAVKWSGLPNPYETDQTSDMGIPFEETPTEEQGLSEEELNDLYNKVYGQ